MLSWTSQVQKHPALKRFSAEPGLGNPLCAPKIVSLGCFVLVGWGTQLVVFSVNHESGSYELRSPLLNFSIGNLISNQTGTLLAVSSFSASCGTGNLVIPLDFLDELDFTVDSSIDIRAYLIKGTNFFPTVHMAWYPFSLEDTILAVLDSASVFRLYDVVESTSKPELELDLGGTETRYDPQRVETRLAVPSPFIADETAVSFSWSSCTGWESLTLFVLYQSGKISSLCPVLPKKSSVSTSNLEALLFSSLRDITSCIPRSTSVSTKLSSKEKKAQDEIALQSSMTVKYLSYMLESKKKSIPSTLDFVPCRVALPYLPFNPSLENKIACSMIVLPTLRASILVVAFADGTIAISTVTKVPSPLWQTQKPPFKSGRLTILDIVHVDADGKCPIQLYIDPLKPKNVIVIGLSANSFDLTSFVLMLNSNKPPTKRLSVSLQSLWSPNNFVASLAFVKNISHVGMGVVLISKDGEIKVMPGRAALKSHPEHIPPPNLSSCLLDYTPSLDPTLLNSPCEFEKEADNGLNSSSKSILYNPPKSLSLALGQLQNDVTNLNQTSSVFQTRLETQKHLLAKIKHGLSTQSGPDGLSMDPLKERLSQAQSRYSAITQKLTSMKQKLEAISKQSL